MLPRRKCLVPLMQRLMQDYVLGTNDEAGVGLLVRSGHYEADLLKRRMKPCYWPAAQHRILRATWFMEKGSDWVPLRVRHLILYIVTPC